MNADADTGLESVTLPFVRSPILPVTSMTYDLIHLDTLRTLEERLELMKEKNLQHVMFSRPRNLSLFR